MKKKGDRRLGPEPPTTTFEGRPAQGFGKRVVDKLGKGYDFGKLGSLA